MKRILHYLIILVDSKLLFTILYFILCFFPAFDLYKVHFKYQLINMSYQYFFSIVIANYNKASYFNRSFGSIYCQNFTDFEVIVVDDFSSDDSLSYLKNISNLHLKIIEHNENKGTLASRIDAARNSAGKYLITLDPDDELECGLLATLYKYLKNEEYDILQYHFKIVAKGGSGHVKQTPLADGFFNRTSLIIMKWETCALWKICFKRNVLLKGVSIIPTKYYYLSGSEDFVIFYSVLIFCNSYRVIDYYGYTYYYVVPKRSALSKRDKYYKTARSLVNELYKENNITLNL